MIQSISERLAVDGVGVEVDDQSPAERRGIALHHLAEALVEMDERPGSIQQRRAAVERVEQFDQVCEQRFGVSRHELEYTCGADRSGEDSNGPF